MAFIFHSFGLAEKILFTRHEENHSPVDVDLSIYNILGQKVANLVSEKQQVGIHKVEWNASDMPSGIYYYQLKMNNGYTETKKMVLLR